MSAALDKTGEATQRRSLMPPHAVVEGLLDDETAGGLVDYAVSRESDFAPTQVGSKAVDPIVRVSTGLRDLGRFRPILKARIFALLPELVARLGVGPIEAPTLETELVAHGDGAFYTRHVDTQLAHYAEITNVRVLSGVYYFHAGPKRFSGGALRLYAIGGRPEADFVDIEPAHNSLLFFPAWAPHAVMPVSCPSKRFADSRFAINCWVHRKKTAAAGLVAP